MPRIYIYLYCREYQGKIEYVRAYKYQAPKKDSTPSSSIFVYSHKSKRYHEAYLYIMDWAGKPLNELPDNKLFRQAILRIGLDVR